MVLPAKGKPWLKLESLPTEKDDLELAIGGRFISAFERFMGESIASAGRAPEPGDVSAIRKSGERIYIQLGEVVDTARIRTNSRRLEYGTAVWQKYPNLQKVFSGVQIAIVDTGEAYDFPKVRSSDGKKLLHQLVTGLETLIPLIESLPANKAGELKGFQTQIGLSKILHPITIRLLRYASTAENSPVKWLWTGAMIISGV